MQIIFNLLRVIFMLSTIVIVADCCSSRILLLREQNLEIIHEHNVHITPEHYPNSDNIEDALEQFLKQFATIKEELQNETDIFTTLLPMQPLDTGQDVLTDLTTTISETTTEINPANTPSDCPDQYSTDFCLNGGRCFHYVFDNDKPFYYCKCAAGYAGERCDGKSLSGDFIPIPPSELKQGPKIVMARIVFSFPMLVALSVLYIIIGALFIIRCPSQKKYEASGMLLS